MCINDIKCQKDKNYIIIIKRYNIYQRHTKYKI